ncbi:guanine deaminase [Colletotrichum sublineola]|uniref:Guanine deaminase n=1 Tax=Colletotrichum sublineola TaxID=1173701 RepID=A0A066XBU2_COLSU|nr:guanine deaminase [Colletotrichum sublineola]KDN63500.1 putative guanine deaminase [Colletotrichum sublineola]
MGDMIRDLPAVASSLSPTTRRNQLFLGTFVHSKTRETLEYLHDTAVCVDASGTIVAVEAGYDLRRSEAELLPRLGWKVGDVEVRVGEEGQFFFPGFIDTHVHASQYPNVGIFGKSTLLDWLNTYTFPLEASLKDQTKAKRVYTACVRRTLAHGTTTSAYYATIDVDATNLLADICLALGQRAFVGRVCMDREGLCPEYYKDESAQDSLTKTRETVNYIRTIDPDFEIVAPILTPRFAPSCSSEAMRGLASMQKELDVLVQTHISENEGEIELVKELFPESASYTDVYDAHGLLGDKTVLAHAIHLSEEEAATIAERGAKVSHCPCSNSSITSGAARVRWLWDKGIDVGLGTDMSGGYSPSILDAARQAALVSRHVAMGLRGQERERAKLTVEEVLYLGTRGGAKVVGLQDKVGGFEVGMQWDAQLIGLPLVDEDGVQAGGGGGEGGNVDIFGWESWEERVAKWLFNGDDRNTKAVWVKGRMVHSRR